MLQGFKLVYSKQSRTKKRSTIIALRNFEIIGMGLLRNTTRPLRTADVRERERIISCGQIFPVRFGGELFEEKIASCSKLTSPPCKTKMPVCLPTKS